MYKYACTHVDVRLKHVYIDLYVFTIDLSTNPKKGLGCFADPPALDQRIFSQYGAVKEVKVLPVSPGSSRPAARGRIKDGHMRAIL